MLDRLLGRADVFPNKFSIPMGELIRQARLEAEMTQQELADRVYKRRPSISDMENGKMVPDAITWCTMAYTLEKPLIYFVPETWRGALTTGELNAEEEELVAQFRRIRSEAHRKLAINQVKSIAEYE